MAVASLIAALLCALAVVVLPVNGPGLALARRFLHWQFSDIHQITPAELSAQLNSTNRPAPVLLDVRTEAEYAISHLPGARRVDPKATAAELAPLIPKDGPVVVYCAMGYRACRVADRLRAAGVTNVSNLDGAIFQWAGEGFPLVSNDHPAKVVHPFNWMGRKLLPKELAADVPSLSEY